MGRPPRLWGEPPVMGRQPLVMGDPPQLWGDPPRLWGEPPRLWGDPLWLWGDSPSYGETPLVNGETAPRGMQRVGRWWWASMRWRVGDLGCPYPLV